MTWKPLAECAPPIRGDQRAAVARLIEQVAPGRTRAEIAEAVGRPRKDRSR